jgi:hypothetical protein
MWSYVHRSVSVKSSPGKHTSAQCGNRGYQNIKPLRSTPVPAPSSGDTHTLSRTNEWKRDEGLR